MRAARRCQRLLTDMHKRWGSEVESRTRGIEARGSILCQTALDALPPQAYAGAAGGIVVDRRTNVHTGDNAGYTRRYIGCLETLES